MKTFTLILDEEEIKTIVAALEGHKQDLVRGMKKEPNQPPFIHKVVTEAIEQDSKIQAYLRYKLNDSEKEAKEYERL